LQPCPALVIQSLASGDISCASADERKNRKAPPGIHAGGTLRGPQKDASVFPDADPSTWIVASYLLLSPRSASTLIKVAVDAVPTSVRRENMAIPKQGQGRFSAIRKFALIAKNARNHAVSPCSRGSMCR